LEIIGMSHFYSRQSRVDRGSQYGDTACRPVDRARPSDDSVDSAIDAALCAVPLPEGLMTRLGQLVHTMAMEPPDQVDWLGC
jgi:hypothetical protein